MPDSNLHDTRPHEAPRPLATPRVFHCRCGRPVFFGNHACMACGAPLGFDPELARLLPLQPGGLPGTWRIWGPETQGATLYRRCGHAADAAVCNWLVPLADGGDGPFPLCRSCRLNRAVPDGGDAESMTWWGRIEAAKRRMVAALIALRLPLRSRVSEDPQQGVAFDLLRAPPGGLPVTTGHADGVITLDLEEADDARREQRRSALLEPYRTLLGHLRHEIGHYYWTRLVLHSGWLQPYREAFGDERQDYAEALRSHYENGPRPGHETRFISAYASAHPWEDWAETWAHYLHMVDTLDTAVGYGLRPHGLRLETEPFGPAVLGVASPDEPARELLSMVNDWVRLTGVLNELNRAMGQPDFYPFVLPAAAVRKLHFVHRVVRGARSGGAPQAPTPQVDQ